MVKFYLEEYRNFILKLIKTKLELLNTNISINLGCNIKKYINIDFQYEHTIILENKNYICKIHNYDYLKTLDYVLEYSNANIEHAKKYGIDVNYINKLIYFPPLLYNLTNDGNRKKT